MKKVPHAEDFLPRQKPRLFCEFSLDQPFELFHELGVVQQEGLTASRP